MSNRLQKFGQDSSVNESIGQYYNLQEIKALEGELQSAIDNMVERYEGLINKAIEKQIHPDHKLYAGMGTAVVEDEHGDNIDRGPAYDFARHILRLQYVDRFDTAMEIHEVRTGR